MSNIEKIGKFEVYALFITIISTNVIINIPSIILDFSSTGSWINIIYITILCTLFALLICKFSKPFISCDILDVSEYLGGKFIKIIIGILYIIFYVFFSAYCLRFFTHSIKMIYFDNISIVLLSILFLIPAVIASKTGLKSISGASIVFLPLSILSLLVFSVVASNYFAWENLFPIFGYGVKETFLLNLPNLFAFNVVSYLYFLKPFIKNEKNYKKISILVVIMCGIYLLISIIILLMLFPFITQTDETLSVYLVTRLISFGRFFQRVDALFIFIWIIIIISFISLNIFILSHIIKKIAGLKFYSPLVYPISAIILAISLMFKDISELKHMIMYVYRIYGVVLIFIVSFLVVIFSYIKNNRKKEPHYEIK